MKAVQKWFAAVLMLFFSAAASAAVYNLPPANDSLIGQIYYIKTETGDNTISIAKKYNIGFNTLTTANSWIKNNSSFNAGTPLKISNQHLLPNESRDGIVINLPEMRIYYYLANEKRVLTYPIGIGKVGQTIPIKKTNVVRKQKDPTWTPTPSIRNFNREQGIILPKVMQPGPDNPLGQFAIYLGIPTYLIHSSPFADSIGKRASFGCIRMFESDIQEFFPTIEKGTQVSIINQPVKVAWNDDSLYLESYQSLQEHGEEYLNTLAGVVNNISDTAKNKPALIDWQLVAYLHKQRDGIPHKIGVILPVN